MSTRSTRRVRTKDGAPVLYTLLVIIAAIVLAVIVLNLIRSGGRSI